MKVAPRSVCAFAAVITAAALLAAPGLSALQPPASRIVAIGDIHGDYSAVAGILETAGLVDRSGGWTGGSAILVQTGDYFDRGPDVRRVMDLLRALEPSAAKAGGRLHVLLGNHDAMNLIGELRDVHPGAYAAFAGSDSEKTRLTAFRDYTALADARMHVLGARVAPYDQRDRDGWLAAHPPGRIEYMAALASRGEYGRWLRDRRIVIEIDGTVFMHAGIDPATAPSALDDINKSIRSEIRAVDAARDYMIEHGLILPFFTLQETFSAAQAEAGALTAGKITAPDARHLRTIETVLKIGKSPLLAGDGPLWFRGFDTWTDDEGPALLAPLLLRYGARRIVAGHSIQRTRQVANRFDGRAFLIDTAMSSVYKGRASALEIAGDRVTAIYAGSRVVLADGNVSVRSH